MTSAATAFLGDACFLLPSFPKTARVIGDAPHAKEAISRAGVRLVVEEEHADVVVSCDGARAAYGAMFLGIGPGRRRRRSGDVFAVVGDDCGVVYAFRAADLRARREVDALRGRAGAASARLRRVLRLGTDLAGVTPVVSVWPDEPMLLRSVREAGLVPEAPWYLEVCPGVERRRGAFVHLDGGPVVKFARQRGDRAKLEREVHGHQVVDDAGSLASRRVPALIGSGEADGFHYVVQRAAPGLPLSALVRHGRRSESMRRLYEVVEWLQEVAVATARRRHGSGSSDSLAGAPAVLAHGDLHQAHIFVTASSFQLIDWELATSNGYPLWDLVYLCINALPVLDGARTDAAHVQALVDAALRHYASSTRFSGADDADTWDVFRQFLRIWSSDARLGARWDAWCRS